MGTSGDRCAPTGAGVTGTDPVHYHLEAPQVFTGAHGSGVMNLCGDLTGLNGAHPDCLTYGAAGGEGTVVFSDATVYRLFDVGWSASIFDLTSRQVFMRGRYELEEHGQATGRFGYFTAWFSLQGGCGPHFYVNSAAGILAFAEI